MTFAEWRRTQPHPIAPRSENWHARQTLLCAIVGHHRRVDESTEIEPVLCCERCGRKQLPPTGSAFGNRVNAKAGADRAVGPFGGRR